MNVRPEFKLEVSGCTIRSVTTWHNGNKDGGLPIACTDMTGEPSAEDFDNADELARRWNAHEELVDFAELVRDFFTTDTAGHAQYLRERASAVLSKLETTAP